MPARRRAITILPGTTKLGQGYDHNYALNRVQDHRLLRVCIVART